MGYGINALIADAALLARHTAGLAGACVVPLTGGLALVPATGPFLSGLPPDEKGGHAGAAEGFEGLTPALASLAARASRDGPVGYVEAEYFGGVGTQWGVVWKDGAVVLGPLVQDGFAINKVLTVLGVSPSAGLDEFDTVGLGRRRSTDGWARG